jgi:DNA-binding NtrC family response regulator
MKMIMATEETQQDQALLTGKRVLLVEDEFYIADDLDRALTSAGACVIGPFASRSKAEAAIASNTFDCAVIDLNLRGESAVPIAERLLSRNIPFAIATGYGSPAVPAHLSEIVRIEKPFDPRQLVKVVSLLTGAQAS